MTQRIDKATARLLLQQWDGWFGPPPIQYDEGLVDGRIRFQEAISLGMSKRVPKPICLTLRSEVARYLALVGHYDRAREWIPKELTNVLDVAAYCHCQTEVVAPLCVSARLRAPRKRVHCSPGRRRAIEKVAAAISIAEQTTGFVSAEDLRKALAAWL